MKVVPALERTGTGLEYLQKIVAGAYGNARVSCCIPGAGWRLRKPD